MKRHRNITVIIVLILILIPAIANAVGFSISSVAKRPLGGKIIRSGQNADIACATISGPIFINPFNTATPGPYFIRSTTGGFPRAGKLFLGNYSLVPDIGTCYNPETGVPIPAFEIKTYGVSR